MKKAIAALAACVLLAAFALSGCGEQNGTKTTAETEAASQADTSAEDMSVDLWDMEQLKEGDAAPDFTAELANGGSFSLADHKSDVVLINFWATWCHPCVGELPAFEQLKADNIAGFELVAVNCEEAKQDVDAFVKENGYTFNIGYDENGSIGKKYPTQGIPYTLIVKDGTIKKIFLGAPADPYSEYKSAVEECLK